MLKLIIEDDEGRKTVVPFARDEITIGRQEGNTIRLTERNVSRRHARLLRQTGHVLIEDLGSSNGIKINGDRIQGQVKINDGDLVQIGDYDLAIQRDEDKSQAPTVNLDAATRPLPKPPPAADPGATMPALPALEPPQAADDDVQDSGPEEATQHEDDVDDGKAVGAEKHHATAVIRIDQIQGSSGKSRKVVDIDKSQAPRVVVMNTDFAGKEFVCTRSEVKIGRVEDNDIALDHRSLSRTHCKLVREDNGDWRVIDMQSANGLMVNGESYAQVGLRSGDVIELGHVKLKFLAAGEKYTPPPQTAGSSVQLSVDEGVDEAPQRAKPALEPVEEESSGGGKGPLIAVAATFVLLIVGVGGYVMWKAGKDNENPKPPKGKPTTVVKNPDTPTTPDTPKNPENPTVDPEAGKKAAEKTLADAREAITAGDFDKAELLLKNCKVGDSPCPEARQMLTQLEGEQGFRRALQEAEAALDAGDLEKARVQLESARSTKLLKDKYEALESRRAEAVKAKIEAGTKKPPETPKPPPENPKPPPTQPKVAAGPNPEVQKLLEEAKELGKEKQWQAVINRMEKCAKIDPSNAECYLKRGTAHGNLKEPELVVKYYKMYLQFAKPDDPMVPKVQQRVKEYEESLKK